MLSVLSKVFIKEIWGVGGMLSFEIFHCLHDRRVTNISKLCSSLGENWKPHQKKKIWVYMLELKQQSPGCYPKNLTELSLPLQSLAEFSTFQAFSFPCVCASTAYWACSTRQKIIRHLKIIKPLLTAMF